MRTFVSAQIHTAVKLCFAHHDNSSDFDDAFCAYADEITGMDGRLEFDLATIRLMASLHNGHTAFDDEWLWRTHGASLGFAARELSGGHWTILESNHPSIPAGAEIVAIDDMTVADFANSKLSYLSASNIRAARTILFQRPYLFREVFSLHLSTGKPIRVRKGEYAPPDRSCSPSLDWIADIPILRIPSFDRDAFEQAAIDTVNRLQTEDVLIIDLRGNGGGNTPQRLLECLMDRPYRTWAATTPRHSGLGVAKGTPEPALALPSEVNEPAPDHFKGRLALLADRQTGSAAEDFLMPFKDNGRATLVGETTVGSSGQPFFQKLGDGMRIWVGAKRQTFPDGSEFEGVGIAPDIACEMTADDARNGNDAFLAKAIEIAR